LWSVTNTNTVGDSRPLCRFGSIPLTMVSQIKLKCGLTKQTLSPIDNSILFFLLFLNISIENLSSNNSCAVIKFGIFEVVNLVEVVEEDNNQFDLIYSLSIIIIE
jgi:hypothetical protein